MHVIKTFKFIGINLHTVFSLNLFYLLCFYGYAPSSLLMCLCSLSLLRRSFCILLARLLFFSISFISAFTCINSFLLLSLSLFYNSFSGFWSSMLHLFIFGLSFFFVNVMELLTTALPLFHEFAMQLSSSCSLLKRWSFQFDFIYPSVI